MSTLRFTSDTETLSVPVGTISGTLDIMGNRSELMVKDGQLLLPRGMIPEDSEHSIAGTLTLHPQGDNISVKVIP